MAGMTEDEILFETLLRLGDDSLILGQRLGEWCGHAPSVEVDLSLANMGLDLIGQATHFLNAAGMAEGQGRDGDAIAFKRDVLDFRNCWLVEQPNGDFAQTMARMFLFSTWQEMLFRHLEGSKDANLRANATWKKMLADYEAPPIDDAVDEELLEFIERKKASFPDSFA